MFKLVVLTALVAAVAAVAKPSGWDYGLEHAPIVTNTYISPAAVSSTYRKEIFSNPAYYGYDAPAVSYGVPVVQKAIVAAPYAYAAHDAFGHSYRSHFVRRPFYARTLVAPTTYRYAPATYRYAPATYRYAPTTYRYSPTTYGYGSTYRYAPATYRYATSYRYAPTSYRYAHSTYKYVPTSLYGATTYRYAQYAHTPTAYAGHHASTEYAGHHASSEYGTHTPSLYSGHTSSHYAPSSAYTW